jgi:secreted Zn-dependent insulinase-like peptidase
MPIIKVKRIEPPISIEIDSKVQNRDERDSGIIMSYECYSIDKINDKKWAKKLGVLMLIEKLVKERFFNELRTVQQSGYIVNSSLSVQGGSFDNVYTLNFNVQSSSRSLQSIQYSITDFINDTVKFIDELDLKVYDEFKRSLIATIMKKYDNIYDELFLYLGAISTYDYMFDYKIKLASELNEISRGDVLNTFEEYFVGKNKKLRVIKVYSRINRID